MIQIAQSYWKRLLFIEFSYVLKLRFIFNIFVIYEMKTVNIFFFRNPLTTQAPAVPFVYFIYVVYNSVFNIASSFLHMEHTFEQNNSGGVLESHLLSKDIFVSIFEGYSSHLDNFSLSLAVFGVYHSLSVNSWPYKTAWLITLWVVTCTSVASLGH